MKINHLPAPKKQTQFKPNFRKAKMNLKSLAGKSGHTRLMDLAIPVGIADVKKACKMQGHEDNGGNGRLSA
jgi:hypothetical protein